MHHDRAGLLYALAGFCTLSVGDAIVKGMAGEWLAQAMVFARYVTATILLGALLARREGWRALALPRAKLQWLRGVAISSSAIGMFMAVWIMPLAEATTIAFSQPVMTALLAMIFLREPARLSTWVATAIAFTGVIVVLRPGFANAGWGAFLPLLGALGLSVTIIANRAVTGTASILALQYYMSVTAMIFLFFAVLVGHFSGVQAFAMHWPHWSVLARCVFVGISASIAQWLIFMGTVKAGAGTVAPMSYGQLLVAVGFGWLFFGDAPDPLVLLGAAIIISAGIFLWYVNRRPKTALPAA